ncbi:MAG TPA: type II toxin-antitoxin system RelE/ParE family toxin [Solirubrobacterales bacterium]|nr:type II toxin-antitoxin system RelE/ParE family toxin [Solirubrobacterales bacterium]
MSWEAERTAEFDEWWKALTDAEQRRVVASVEALEELGPTAGRPLVDSVKGSKHPNMKELRIGSTIRVFFAFDPRQIAILLIGGDKAGKTKRFYKQMVRKADRIYEKHLKDPRHAKDENDGGSEEVQGAQRGGP